MAADAQVGKLVDDDGIEHERRRQDESPAEREVAARGGRGPATALVADGQSPWLHPELGGPDLDPLAEPVAGTGAQPTLESGRRVIGPGDADDEPPAGQLDAWVSPLP